MQRGAGLGGLREGARGLGHCSAATPPFAVTGRRNCAARFSATHGLPALLGVAAL